MADNLASFDSRKERLDNSDVGLNNNDETDVNNKGINTFANDGSFMELFKKKMEEKKLADKEAKTLNIVGKRRGGKVLKTGLVKKQRAVPQESSDEDTQVNRDAWSRYMAEVKKYKAQACEDDGKTRPLVK